MLYLWTKVFHIIAFVSWMAAILYLPRLFINHVHATPGGELSEQLKGMERRLMKAIMTPAMIATWALGLWLAFQIGAWDQGWFHVKLAAVVAMSVIHMMLAADLRRFANDANEKSTRYYRIINEVPTALLVLIVIMVVVKPI